MIFSAILQLSIVFLLTTKFSAAIECKFRFEDDSTFNEMIVAGESVIVANELPDSERFECEQPEESEEADDEVESRFNFDRFEPDDDDYESAVVCETRNKTIYPKGLNNVKNEWKRVVNKSNFIQAIVTEECVFQNRKCSEISTSRCVQQYVQIHLKAYDGITSREYNDRFYFPSSCACEFPGKKVQMSEVPQELTTARGNLSNID